MLADGVNNAAFGRQVDGLGVFEHVLDVLLRNRAIGRNHGMNPVIVEAANMIAGDSQVNAADFDIGHLLGFDDGVADVLLGQGGLGDFAFAHAARAGLAHADDVESAAGIDFADYGANLGGANFQSDDDVGWIKHFSF